MNEFKHVHHEKSTQPSLYIEFTNKKGSYIKYKIDFWILFLILSILLSLSFSYMYLYHDIKKQYIQIQSSTRVAEGEYQRVMAENEALRLDIETLKSDFQATKDELNSILEYKAKLEKSTLIKSLTN